MDDLFEKTPAKSAPTLPLEADSLTAPDILPLLRIAADQFDGTAPVTICAWSPLNLRLNLEPVPGEEDQPASAIYSLRHGGRQLFCWKQALSRPLEKTLPYFAERLAPQWEKVVAIFRAQK